MKRDDFKKMLREIVRELLKEKHGDLWYWGKQPKGKDYTTHTKTPVLKNEQNN